MTPPELHSLADRINTGTDDQDASRGLVVFNLTDSPLSGVAVFHASMSWPQGVLLPPILITQGSEIVPCAIRNLTEEPDAKGRADRRKLSFALFFAVSDIPAQGWRTYIAAYAEAPSPPLRDFVETLGLSVVETTRHGGDLPPVGTF